MSDAATRDRRAIETTGAVDETGRLHLDAPLAEGATAQAVRVIVLFDDDEREENISEQAWLRAAGQNPAFDFLDAPEEDLYTAEDGTPFHDEAPSPDDDEA